MGITVFYIIDQLFIFLNNLFLNKFNKFNRLTPVINFDTHLNFQKILVFVRNFILDVSCTL